MKIRDLLKGIIPLAIVSPLLGKEIISPALKEKTDELFTGKINLVEGTSWYKNGMLHRDNGLAVEWRNGIKHWCKNGKLHRDDGPAIETVIAGDHNCWYKNGKLHRDNGPAVEVIYCDELCGTELNSVLKKEVKNEKKRFT